MGNKISIKRFSADFNAGLFVRELDEVDEKVKGSPCNGNKTQNNTKAIFHTYTRNYCIYASIQLSEFRVNNSIFFRLN